jgi:hypothetical protein
MLHLESHQHYAFILHPLDLFVNNLQSKYNTQLLTDYSNSCNTTAVLNPNDKPDYGLKDSETKQGLEERREKGKPHSIEPCGQQRTNLNN